MDGEFQILDCEPCQPLNSVLCDTVLQQIQTASGRRTHFFNGRFENIYLPVETLPGMSFILEHAQMHAAQLLQMHASLLRIGFWLNVMQHNEITSLHTHDDDDELLSGTYYINAPEGSGCLRLHLSRQHVEIEPRAGRFVFFAPATPHEVLQHQSMQPRISIGFNIGLA